MKLSPITRAQWVSVIKNAAFAAVAAVIALSQSGTNDKHVLLMAALMAGFKVIEKAFTPAA